VFPAECCNSTNIPFQIYTYTLFTPTLPEPAAKDKPTQNWLSLSQRSRYSICDNAVFWDTLWLGVSINGALLGPSAHHSSQGLRQWPSLECSFSLLLFHLHCPSPHHSTMIFHFNLTFLLFYVCNFSFIIIFRSQDSAVGTVTGYGLDDWGVRVRVLVWLRNFSSPRRPYRLWGPPSLLFNGY
jgi:hypothetical protein